MTVTATCVVIFYLRHLETEQSKVLMETEEYHRLRHRIISERLRDLQMTDISKKKDILIDCLSRDVDQLSKDLLDLQRRYKSALITRNKRLVFPHIHRDIACRACVS